ncbi:MAG: T9SS type A sorting domain-containing protein [Flavobacteriaceae bacterium]|nr:T9SS type A sorting domain-containing protein [Flavobacteriaceae bacterium]
MKRPLLTVALTISALISIAQNQFWQKQNNFRISENSIIREHLPINQIFNLDLDAMKQALENAPVRGEFSGRSNVIISFPNGEGELEHFRVFEASVMHPDLQERYPNIRSYAGQGVEDPSSTIRFSLSPKGLQSMRLSASKDASFIEPISNDNQSYTIYKRADRTGSFSDFECTITESASNSISESNTTLRNADDGILRTYRLAMSATGEYTQYHGGTKADALAAIVTTMTRVNGIFEVDFNVTMQLISNTDDVIYTNPASDPYGNTTGNYNNELQSTLTSVIGEALYDVGHLVANLQNNGNAGCIGCVCVNNQKGSGWTSAVVPTGDFFDVDYVAHEIGHQFGANHTWTFGGNEGTNVQVEPGSGSTIMSYAGITGATDVQANVTPNFHAVSIEQVTDYVKSTSCQTNIVTGNAVPTVSAGSDYTIPKGTPFILEGTASDANTLDVLSYCWEQMDENNASTTYPSLTNTTGVAFRAYEPVADSHRYFPRLETIKTGATSWQWEAVPDVARTLNFRLTVRDNVAGGGTNNSDDVVVTVNGTAGPFVVSSPNTNVTWNADSFETVTWDVAGTTSNGVNASNVDIFLSTDGGDTYPITLASGVTNDGSHDIVVPNNQGSQNRIMVRGENHIFFDISDTNFTIGAPIVCTATIPTNFTSLNLGSTSATLSWDAITSVVFDIQYRDVGSGTWTTVSTSNTSLDLTGLTPETNYEAQIRSRCPDNSTSAYSSPVINFTTTAIPPCVGTQITSYPYLETFDSGIGDWLQESGDDGNWTLDANGTPSPSTGPSDDITGGGNYYFTEASNSGLGQNATTILVSPCFDLSSLNEAYFTFYYHMYGSNMGSLSLDISNDNGNTWDNLFSISGDQGNSWISNNIDLDSYLGQVVKFKFTGITGNGFRSDITIDHIGVTDVPLPTTYCASNGNSTVDEYINRVQLGTIDNNNSGAGITSTGYSDFTSQSTVLYGGQNYTITITPEWTGSAFNEGYSVWIDYNHNGSFDDIGEQVFTQSPTAATTVSGVFTVPLDLEYGTTAMRVSLMWNDIPNSCGSFGFGEVEDYTIDLQYDGLLYNNNTWTPNAPSSSTETSNVLFLEGTYNVASSIKVNDLNIISGASVDVSEGTLVEVNGDLNNNGELTLNSSSTAYSSLIVSGTSTGNVKYKRHVNAYNGTTGNDLISSPLTGQNFGDFASDNPNIYENSVTPTQKLFGPFNKSTDWYQIYDSVGHASEVLGNGIGYRAARDSSEDGISGTTFTFTGGVNTANVDVSIVTQGTNYEIWNLIGNPYPSYIVLDDFLAANNSKLDSQSAGVYGYNGQATDKWEIWNLAYAAANPNTVITPGQGFFVASQTGGATIEFTPSMRSTGSSDDFISGRNTTNSIYHLKLKATKASDYYETDFYFTENASLGLDAGYDAGIFGNVAPSFAIYSELVNDNQGVDMAIQSISTLDLENNTIIPFGINSQAGEQLIVSIEQATLPENVNVYLEDSVANTMTLLNTNDFIITPNTNLNDVGRFFLRFETETLSTIENEFEELVIYNTNSPKVLYIKGQLSEPSILNLYNIQGQIILSEVLKTNNNTQQIDISNMASGVYLARIESITHTVSKKIIIN